MVTEANSLIMLGALLLPPVGTVVEFNHRSLCKVWRATVVRHLIGWRGGLQSAGVMVRVDGWRDYHVDACDISKIVSVPDSAPPLERWRRQDD